MILAAFIIAFFTSILFLPYRSGSIASLMVFFVILFMAAVASQFWIVPFGPVTGGVAWLPMLFTVIIFALLFSTPSPRMKKANHDEATQPASVIAISVFTWVLFAVLFITIVAGVYKTAL